MRLQPPATSAVAVPAQATAKGIEQHVLFRLGIFMLSAAAGCFFTRLAYAGIRLLPSLGAGAHQKVNPLIDVLKTLHSGFNR